MKKISDYLPPEEILAQMAEEAAELAQAALKLRRAMDETNPTPKSVDVCLSDLVEEYADVTLCVNEFVESEFSSESFDNSVKNVMHFKRKRWISRLKERNAENQEPSKGV